MGAIGTLRNCNIYNSLPNKNFHSLSGNQKKKRQVHAEMLLTFYKPQIFKIVQIKRTCRQIKKKKTDFVFDRLENTVGNGENAGIFSFSCSVFQIFYSQPLPKEALVFMCLQ